MNQKVEYQDNPSPFYKENESFCRAIENVLRGRNASYGGFCDSYGYQVVAHLNSGKMVYRLEFWKTQPTTSKYIFFRNEALVFSGLKVEVKGLLDDLDFVCKPSKFRRLLSRREWKDLFPKPYCFSSNFVESHPKFPGQLIEFINKHPNAELKLNRGTLRCEIPDESRDLFSTMSILDSVIASFFS